MSEQIQRWEVVPKVFAVRSKSLLLESYPARTSPPRETQLEVLESVKNRLVGSQLPYYGTFGARVYFGSPGGEWREVLSKLALWWLFNEILEIKCDLVTEQAVLVSGWGWIGDKKLLANPMPHGGTEQLHSALLRTQFLPWREYLQSAELHGLTQIPEGMFSPESGRPIYRADLEED